MNASCKRIVSINFQSTSLQKSKTIFSNLCVGHFFHIFPSVHNILVILHSSCQNFNYKFKILNCSSNKFQRHKRNQIYKYIKHYHHHNYHYHRLITFVRREKNLTILQNAQYIQKYNDFGGSRFSHLPGAARPPCFC